MIVSIIIGALCGLMACFCLARAVMAVLQSKPYVAFGFFMGNFIAILVPMLICVFVDITMLIPFSVSFVCAMILGAVVYWIIKTIRQ